MIKNSNLDRLDPDPLGRPRWNTNPTFLAEHPELQPFVVHPAVYERTWQGDDEDAPAYTVALRFDTPEAEAAALAAFVVAEGDA
jgi:hypothetical protein